MGCGEKREFPSSLKCHVLMVFNFCSLDCWESGHDRRKVICFCSWAIPQQHLEPVIQCAALELKSLLVS